MLNIAIFKSNLSFALVMVFQLPLRISPCSQVRAYRVALKERLSVDFAGAPAQRFVKPWLRFRVASRN
jgi:hypothetical protein